MNMGSMGFARLAHHLARDVLVLAVLGNMPDSFWMTDRRIGRAARTLDYSRMEARTWARRRTDQIRARRTKDHSTP